MRKILALILAMTMSLSLVSCGGKKPPNQIGILRY